MNHKRYESTIGELCIRGFGHIGGKQQDATHKIEEVIFQDDEMPIRHPYTSYLCCYHFMEVMGPAVHCFKRKKSLSETEMAPTKSPQKEKGN